MADFNAVKKLATLPTRTVSLCLAGELVDEADRLVGEIAQLEQQLADVGPPTSLGDTSPKRAITERIAAVQEQIAPLREQMQESTVDFHLLALGARKWARFWASMPTRSEAETDEAWDERIYPFYAQMLSRSCVDPEMSVEQVDELVEVIHNSAWSRLVISCLGLNQGGIDIPNSVAVSDLTGNSEQT